MTISTRQLAELRYRTRLVASSIADTEERVAGTLERLAVNRPREAARLLAHAAQAREFAETERRLAAAYDQVQLTPLPPETLTPAQTDRNRPGGARQLVISARAAWPPRQPYPRTRPRR